MRAGWQDLFQRLKLLRDIILKWTTTALQSLHFLKRIRQTFPNCETELFGNMNVSGQTVWAGFSLHSKERLGWIAHIKLVDLPPRKQETACYLCHSCCFMYGESMSFGFFNMTRFLRAAVLKCANMFVRKLSQSCDFPFLRWANCCFSWVWCCCSTPQSTLCWSKIKKGKEE